MSAIIGYVTQQLGDAVVTHTNGDAVSVAAHMSVHMNDRIETADNATVILVLDNGNVLRIGPNQSVLLDETVFRQEITADETEVEAEAIRQALAANGDIDALDSAAGTEGQTPVEGGSSLAGADGFTSHLDNSGFTYAEGVTQNTNVEGSASVPLAQATPVTEEGTADIDTSAPYFLSDPNAEAVENQNLLYRAEAVDTEGSVSYALTGTDASLLVIDPVTGEVTLAGGTLDFESKELYNFSVVATDEAGNSTTLPVTVNVTNVVENTAPVLGADTSVDVAENSTAVGNYAATDAEGDSITYTLSGDDAALFTIDSAGNLSFIDAPDYDAGETGPYSVTITATDDGEGTLFDTQSVTVNVTDRNDQAPIFAVTAATALVMEGALSGGNIDTTAPSDTTVATGSFGITDNDSAVSVTLTAPTDTITSNGTAVTWSGAGTSTLIGTANGEEVIRVAINDSGDYTVTLSGPVDHAVADVEDVLNFDVGVTATDGIATTNGTLTVSVEDDIPVSNDFEQNLTLNSNEVVTTNLIIVLDTSGSMGWDVTLSDGTVITRLQLAKDALETMIERYDEIGNVNVQLVGFASTSTESGWFEDDVNGAIAYIEALIADGGTDYEDALQTVIDGYSEPAATNSVLYFISDGDSTEGNFADLAYTDAASTAYSGITAWETFVDDHIDNMFSIGIGPDITTDNNNTGGDLEDIAHPGSAILVENEEELANTLYETINTGATGTISVLHSSMTGEGISIGADEGRIESVTLSDGTTIVYDPSQTQPVDITTPLGGTLTINFSTGEYTYDIQLTDDNYGSQEIFGIVVVDNDGDTGSGNLTMNLDFTAPVDANYDRVVTNMLDGESIAIPESALLYNDQTRSTAEITSADHAIDGSVAAEGETIRFTLDGGSSSFGASATTITENSSDSGSNDLNGTMVNAVDLTDRSLFGPVSGPDAADVVNAGYASVKFLGTINDTTSGRRTNADTDYLKVSLVAGERLILDIDYGANSGDSVDTVLTLLDSAGNVIASNDDSAIDGGSSSTYDSYLEAVAPEDGIYYIHVDNYSNRDNGDYQLWLSIDDDGVSNGSFEYTVTDDTLTDTATVDVVQQSGYTVTGSDEDEILIGREGQADVLNAGAGDDALIFDHADTTVDGGAGYDNLIFTTDTDLDFGTLDTATNPITNVEQMDLSLAAVTLDHLTVEDVLDITGNGSELTIFGTSESTVNLQNSGTTWTASGQVSENGHTFDVYTNNTVTVKIEQDINDTIQS